jgi:hypothetical protein
MRSQMTRGSVTSPRCSRRTARHAGSALPGQARAQQAQPALAAITTAVRDVLTAAGFSDVRASGSQNPMWFGSDPDDAQRFVVGLLGWMLHGLDDADRDRALEDLRHAARPLPGRSGRNLRLGYLDDYSDPVMTSSVTSGSGCKWQDGRRFPSGRPSHRGEGPAPMPRRVSPTDRIRGQIGELFAQDRRGGERVRGLAFPGDFRPLDPVLLSRRILRILVREPLGASGVKGTLGEIPDLVPPRQQVRGSARHRPTQGRPAVAHRAALHRG